MIKITDEMVGSAFSGESRVAGRYGGFKYGDSYVIRDHVLERREERTEIVWTGQTHEEMDNKLDQLRLLAILEATLPLIGEECAKVLEAKAKEAAETIRDHSLAPGDPWRQSGERQRWLADLVQVDRKYRTAATAIRKATTP